MKTIEDLRKEYQQLTDEELYCPSLEDLVEMIQADILDLEEDRCDILKEIRIDLRNKRIDQLKQFFSAFSGVVYDLSFYDVDMKLLEEKLNTNLSFINYYHQLQELLTEENFNATSFLKEFTSRYYQKNWERLECLRDINEYRIRGIAYYNPQLEEDTRDIFEQFFQEEITNISAKSVAYKKKM